MAKLTPQEFAAKWASRTSAASADYATGVGKVTVSPGQSAAAAADLWLARTTASKKKFQANAGAVDLQAWKTAAQSIGAARLAQGVQAKQAKMAQVAAVLLPAVDAARASIQSMPRDNLEARIARSAAFQRAMNKAFAKG